MSWSTWGSPQGREPGRPVASLEFPLEVSFGYSDMMTLRRELLGRDLGPGGGTVVTMSHIFIGYSFLVPSPVGDLFRAAVGPQVVNGPCGLG